MTESELDVFFTETLKKILEDTKDCAAYIQHLNTPEYEEIKEDYQADIEDLTALIKEIKSIDDLAETDEDTITRVFEFIEGYAGNFVISAQPEQKKKDLEEYAKLEEILNLFFDSDEDEEEDFE